MAVKVADAGGRKALARVALIATLLAACCVGSTADQALAASVARPLIRAGGGVVNELPTVNVPSVLAKAIEASAGSPSHSRAFTDFMAKFDKATGYCPDGPPPCEESIRRERIFLENVATIEAHNAAQDQAGGMRLGVTRFTDLTQEEFSQHHGGGFAGADNALHTHHADQDSTLERASERHEARGWARLFSLAVSARLASTTAAQPPPGLAEGARRFLSRDWARRATATAAKRRPSPPNRRLCTARTAFPRLFKTRRARAQRGEETPQQTVCGIRGAFREARVVLRFGPRRVPVRGELPKGDHPAP